MKNGGKGETNVRSSKQGKHFSAFHSADGGFAKAMEKRWRDRRRVYDAAERERERERGETRERQQRGQSWLPISASARDSSQKGSRVYGYVRTAAIGGRISRRCYPQTRGFDQFIPRDEANVAWTGV